MSITNRQKELLQIIIEKYIKVAKPVASEYLAESFGGEVSPATVRNEMAELTKQGYLSQPHISSGRIPCAKGFEYYVGKLLARRDLSIVDKKALVKIKQDSGTSETLIKQIAKQIAVLAKALSIVALSREQFYYTGLTYLFSQPEFSQSDIICDVSRVVDHLDGIMPELFESTGEKTEILIGKENPFSEFCGAIVGRCHLPNRTDYSLIGLLGPVRMDYGRGVALVDYAKEMLMR